MKAPYGPSFLEDLRIDVPAANLRSHHPDDSQAVPEAYFTWGKSSAGQHMHLHGLRWRKVGVDGEQFVDRSSQWGSQFDKPRHYMENGATDIETDLPSGPGVVVDIREALAQKSNGLAITKDVIDEGLEAAFASADPQEKAHFFRRILLRSLTDEMAGSEVALQQFPHFRDQEAVHTLADRVKAETGLDVAVLFHEPASVDEANQGHLAAENPETHEGGAHGALHQRGILIGENWDLSRFVAGTTGNTLVHFDPNLGASPDSALVAGGYFIPSDRREEVIRALFA